MADQPEKPKYFWTESLAEPKYRDLVAAFLLVSFADLFATLRLLAMGAIREGNAVANWVLAQFGGIGFIIFKVLLVALVLIIAGYINTRRPGVARSVLWAGILITGVVLLRHIAIMLRWL